MVGGYVLRVWGIYGVTLLGFIVSFAWWMVFSEGLKNCVRGDSLGVIKVVVCCKLCVDVISFLVSGIVLFA